MSTFDLSILETSISLRQEIPLAQARVAVVHDWMTSYAGSEKVVEQILQLFPQADVFTLVDTLPKKDRGFVEDRTIRTSFLQRFALTRKHFRKFLWLLPSAIESLDVSAYDIVISSSHAVAKGILTGPHQLHVCYCHTPIRYAWDLQHEYLKQSGLEGGLKSLYARMALHYLRLWDIRTASGVDHFVANSRFIAKRINKVYRRSSSVVHPPVDVNSFQLQTEKEDFYLTASRVVPYKRIDAIVQAFALLPDKKLVVIGDGSSLEGIRKSATSNVEFLGFQSDEALRKNMRNAKAFIFAAEEDFGITLVEAQACGTPVICFGRGGALDSVIPGRTGLFFQQQTGESIAEAVKAFETMPWSFAPDEIREHSERFSEEVFREKFMKLVSEQWSAHQLPMQPVD